MPPPDLAAAVAAPAAPPARWLVVLALESRVAAGWVAGRAAALVPCAEADGAPS
jgi:hypothetical protein